MIARRTIDELRAMSAGSAIDRVVRQARLRRWRAREEIVVRCGGRSARLRVRRNSTDADVAAQCFIDNQYEVPVVAGNPPVHRAAVQATYERILGSGSVPLIVDCGANIGASAAWFDLRYPGCRIVAVEPAPGNCAILRLNARDRANVDVIQAGLSAEDGEAFLHDGGGGAWGYRTTAAGGDVSVPMVSLKTVLRDQDAKAASPFILKIDVEGAESGLFGTACDEFARFPLIIIEPHDFCMPGQGTALPFFRFHADRGRDFLFGIENIFSLDFPSLARGARAP